MFFVRLPGRTKRASFSFVLPATSSHQELDAQIPAHERDQAGVSSVAERLLQYREGGKGYYCMETGLKLSGDKDKRGGWIGI